MDQITKLWELWPIFLSFLGFVIWLVRLEGKVKTLDRDHAVLLSKHESLDSELVHELGKVKEALARIEGRLSIPVETAK